ncbi:TrbI/VirB10 family protein [uncultured Novosphingobium sp.]|uniref:TrbI/VirB10 family protein n=1 Tax=uncultured Novosphingobium sp. TaxID=292277 RepID=UPI00258CD671|nr:TrbI/VirB10 family protein [uncultured Novosphingobium sp.]
MALKPQVFRQVAQESELSQPMAKPASDALSGLPASYGEAPKLGPPLPGDLGRPILRAQERAEATAAPTSVDTEAAALQERLAEIKAARESGLMAQTTTGRGPAAPTASDGAPSSTDAQTASSTSTSTRKEQFATTRDTGSDLNSGGLVPPVSPNTLLSGSVIAASLITGLNSDLPGMVTAQVTQNVFDTVTGNILLVPQGARLIGKYDSVVAFGQRRALVIWQRLILPDGSAVRLDNMPATNAGGYAGIADKVDFHTWTLLKGVAIATLLGVGSEVTISGENDLVQAIRQSAQTNTARVGDQITQRNLDIQPTITIRPGAPVRVLVTRDLILAPWRGKVS